MTVINAMKFDNETGAIISDTQSSGSARKYDIATKLHKYDAGNSSILVGGTGNAAFLEDVNQRTSQMVEQSRDHLKSAYDLTSVVGEAFAQIKRKFVSTFLHSTYGLSEPELRAGVQSLPDGRTLTLDNHIKEHYMRILRGGDELQTIVHNYALVLGMDAAGTHLYGVDTSLGAACLPHPYASAGSGADSADNELYDFVESIPREGRKNINCLDGIAALLYATDRASRRNIGVGGTPHLAVLGKGGVITPNEQSLRLAVEVVNGTKHALLPKEFQDRALQGLIYGNDFAGIEDQMWSECQDKKKLDLLLRGYKC